MFEHMFEHEGMTDAALSISSPAQAGEEIRVLQSRIRDMQATKLDTRAVPTHPALAGLLPGGALRSGSAYSVQGSTSLLMAMMAGPSSEGMWCGVIGLPDFGVEAAARFGIDLERLALVPHPGDQWLTVTAAMADVVGVVVTSAPGRLPDSAVARLQARIRQRDATLIVLGDWPQSEATLSVSESSWEGIGEGHGYLSGRRVTVSATARSGSGRPRRARLWLPDGEELLRPVHGGPMHGGAGPVAVPAPVPSSLPREGTGADAGDAAFRPRLLQEVAG
jgi:hypothetical protein